MSHSPVVAHLMRHTPASTETFVENQLNALKRWKPIGIAHHHAEDELSSEVVVMDRLAPLGRHAAEMIYRAARHPSAQATQIVDATIRERGASVIHAHYTVDARFWLKATRRSGLPLIVSAYGYDVSSFPRSMLGLGARYLAPVRTAANLTLAMSEAMMEDLVALGFPRERVEVHYYGVPTDRFSKARRNRSSPVAGWPMILSVGRLVPKKGHADLIDAVRILRDDGVDCRLRVVGQGTLAAELATQVAASDLGDRVEFSQHIPHHDTRLEALYRSADIFALPSRTAPDGDKEGIPGVIVEAMAAGLPVVSTRHAGIPTVVRHGVTGLLSAEGDVPGLAKSLADLISAPARADAMGRAGARLAIERFDVSAAARRLEAIYDRVARQS